VSSPHHADRTPRVVPNGLAFLLDGHHVQAPTNVMAVIPRYETMMWAMRSDGTRPLRHRGPGTSESHVGVGGFPSAASAALFQPALDVFQHQHHLQRRP
jgi:hypothetical protein